ncbi:MAG: DUF1028 domain-containing protein [Anaerolineae bacterium]|nr:DUF1028 domain-containing protein [Anaerolineae bacterium]
MIHPSTFSIVACDPDQRAWGVAVASKFLGVGCRVPWAKAEVGAIATQSWAKISFGPDGLAMMESGRSAAETLAALLAADPGRERRQVGVVDRHGSAAAHTGTECADWAGHRVGEGFACQGNILAGARVIDAMVDAYQGTRGELAVRLMAALTAGDDAGGDKRGKQAAALVVVKMNAGYGGDNDRYVDVRVDDDLEPVARLADLLSAHFVFFGHPLPEDRLPITGDLARELQDFCQRLGYTSRQPDGSWDAAAIRTFDVLVGNENLEERWRTDDPQGIDRVALEYLRKRFPVR